MLLSKIEKQPVKDKLTLLFSNFKPNTRKDLKIKSNTNPIFRKLGYRSEREIECEKNALQILRGDYDVFSAFPSAGGLSKLDRALLSIEL